MEKGNKVMKTRKDLPAWYYRVLNIPGVLRGKVDVEGYMFDKDISELDEEEERKMDEEKPFECHCEAAEDSNLECWCESDSEYEADDMSERSYNGSDADCYYEMKQQREERKKERKKELKEERKCWEKEKQEDLEFHKRKVEEIRAVYKALEENGGEGPAITVLEPAAWMANSSTRRRAKTFDLFCTDYVENCFHLSSSDWGSITFSEEKSGIDIMKGYKGPKKIPTREKANANIYVNCDDDNVEFSTFVVPDHASEDIYWSDLWMDKYQVGVQFIGQDYIRVIVSRDIIEASERKSLPACPETFEFMGINRYSAKHKAETEEWIQKKRR
ncbi:hypothetical protein F4781DRAFT_392974 [Annulohypoxylon bovei var. microspora]|nr:hypothetical protein F4781DRAFT_392974 [Annulohypoxylon bovei var. microspora]